MPESSPATHTRHRPALTPRGWLFLAGSLAVGGLGAVVHEPAFVQIGLFGLILLGVAWAIARRNLRGITIERSAPEIGSVGEKVPVRVVLRGPERGFGARSIDYRDELLGVLGEGASVGQLRPGEAREYAGETRLRKRGRHLTFRWELASSYPGGFWRVRESGWHTVPVIVFPRPVRPAHWDDPRAAREEEEGDTLYQPLPDWSGEYLGIREFAPGDPLKHIHWRATARAQRLVVREFDQRLPASYALFFHSYQPENARRAPDAFESALELLAGLLLRCREEAVPLHLSADFLGWRSVALTGSRSLREPLTWLAEAKWTPSSDLTPLAEKLAAVPEGSHVFIISDTPLRHWQPLLPRCAAETTCLSVGEMRRRRPFIAKRSVSSLSA